MQKPIDFKPMLAGKLTKPEKLQFPGYVSPKIDGIRCTCFDGKGYSRSGKEFPNPYVRELLERHGDDLEYMDGELVYGDPTDPNCMQNTSSIVMSKDKVEGRDVKFYAFDLVNWDGRYQRAFDLLTYVQRCVETPFIKLVPQYAVSSVEALDLHEAQFLEQGYEGMMYTADRSLYKFGRSTEKEAALLKVKRFEDAEAIIIGYEQEVDKNGLPKGTLGAVLVRNLTDDVEFSVGSGFTAKDRESLWYLRDQLVGRIITYKFFNHGIRVAPRHPVFKGFRDEVDMDPAR